jgi:hypothetical protein
MHEEESVMKLVEGKREAAVKILSKNHVTHI